MVVKVRMCDFREREVINMCDCKRLGFVSDLIVDLCNCCVEAIIIPGPGRICGFLGSTQEYIIPVACIKKVGPDIILVEICEEKCLHDCKY